MPGTEATNSTAASHPLPCTSARFVSSTGLASCSTHVHMCVVINVKETNVFVGDRSFQLNTGAPGPGMLPHESLSWSGSLHGMTQYEWCTPTIEPLRPGIPKNATCVCCAGSRSTMPLPASSLQVGLRSLDQSTRMNDHSYHRFGLHLVPPGSA